MKIIVILTIFLLQLCIFMPIKARGYTFTFETEILESNTNCNQAPNRVNLLGSNAKQFYVEQGGAPVFSKGIISVTRIPTNIIIYLCKTETCELPERVHRFTRFKYSHVITRLPEYFIVVPNEDFFNSLTFTLTDGSVHSTWTAPEEILEFIVSKDYDTTTLTVVNSFRVTGRMSSPRSPPVDITTPVYDSPVLKFTDFDKGLYKYSVGLFAYNRNLMESDITQRDESILENEIKFSAIANFNDSIYGEIYTNVGHLLEISNTLNRTISLADTVFLIGFRIIEKIPANESIIKFNYDSTCNTIFDNTVSQQGFTSLKNRLLFEAGNTPEVFNMTNEIDVYLFSPGTRGSFEYSLENNEIYVSYKRAAEFTFSKSEPECSLFDYETVPLQIQFVFKLEDGLEIETNHEWPISVCAIDVQHLPFIPRDTIVFRDNTQEWLIFKTDVIDANDFTYGSQDEIYSNYAFRDANGSLALNSGITFVNVETDKALIYDESCSEPLESDVIYNSLFFCVKFKNYEYSATPEVFSFYATDSSAGESEYGFVIVVQDIPVVPCSSDEYSGIYTPSCTAIGLESNNKKGENLIKVKFTNVKSSYRVIDTYEYIILSLPENGTLFHADDACESAITPVKKNDLVRGSCLLYKGNPDYFNFNRVTLDRNEIWEYKIQTGEDVPCEDPISVGCPTMFDRRGVPVGQCPNNDTSGCPDHFNFSIVFNENFQVDYLFRFNIFVQNIPSDLRLFSQLAKRIVNYIPNNFTYLGGSEYDPDDKEATPPYALEYSLLEDSRIIQRVSKNVADSNGFNGFVIETKDGDAWDIRAHVLRGSYMIGTGREPENVNINVFEGGCFETMECYGDILITGPPSDVSKVLNTLFVNYISDNTYNSEFKVDILIWYIPVTRGVSWSSIAPVPHEYKTTLPIEYRVNVRANVAAFNIMMGLLAPFIKIFDKDAIDKRVVEFFVSRQIPDPVHERINLTCLAKSPQGLLNGFISIFGQSLSQNPINFEAMHSVFTSTGGRACIGLILHESNGVTFTEVKHTSVSFIAAPPYRIMETTPVNIDWAMEGGMLAAQIVVSIIPLFGISLGQIVGSFGFASRFGVFTTKIAAWNARGLSLVYRTFSVTNRLTLGSATAVNSMRYAQSAANIVAKVATFLYSPLDLAIMLAQRVADFAMRIGSKFASVVRKVSRSTVTRRKSPPKTNRQPAKRKRDKQPTPFPTKRPTPSREPSNRSPFKPIKQVANLLKNKLKLGLKRLKMRVKRLLRRKKKLGTKKIKPRVGSKKHLARRRFRLKPKSRYRKSSIILKAVYTIFGIIQGLLSLTIAISVFVFYQYIRPAITGDERTPFDDLKKNEKTRIFV